MHKTNTLWVKKIITLSIIISLFYYLNKNIENNSKKLEIIYEEK
jgi:YbbR domain-containing protein